MSDLYLKQLAVGPMDNFVYLLGSKAAKTCVAVDPAWDIAAIMGEAAKDGMTLTGALVTHYHPDHCGGHFWGHDIEGVAELSAAAHVPIYAHADEVAGIMKVTGLAKSDLRPTQSGDKLALGAPGGAEITMIHTPGHTPGSQCFLCENSLVAGDTLFISGCGRVDLPGGDSDQLHDSLKNKLGKLPKDTILYPGHNYDAVAAAPLADVETINPFLRAGSLAEWRRLFRA